MPSYRDLDNKEDKRRYNLIISQLESAITIMESDIEWNSKCRLLRALNCDRYQYGTVGAISKKFKIKENQDFLNDLKEELQSFQHALKQL